MSGIRSGVMRPVPTSCFDHTGPAWSRVHTWTGSAWEFASEWYQADEQLLKPMIKQAADKCATERKVTRRSADACQS